MAAENKLSWGIPTIFVKDLGTIDAKWKKLFTPVENSTELVPTKGDKQEAKIEGGENEAVKYKKSTYEVNYNIRRAKDRKPPMPSQDGVVLNNYAFLLQPEDPTTDGFYIEKTSVSIDETYTAADGAIWQVVMSALKPDAGNTVKWGVVTTSTEAEKTVVSFTENSNTKAPNVEAKTFTNEEYVDNNA